MNPLTWVYCLVRDTAAPDLAAAPPGLPDAGPPRLLPAAPPSTGSAPAGDGVWLVVADVPRDEYAGEVVEARLADLGWISERALAHERVARQLHGEGGAERAVLPVKLFTLFRNDDRARAWAAGERRRLSALLERLAGRVELGVRVRFDPEVAPAEDAAGAGERPASGADFLRAKRDLRRARQEAASRAPEAASAAHAELAAAAEAAHRLPLPEAAGSLLLDAAYLLPSAGVDAFERVVARVAVSLRQAGCELTLTGPWPPYNFAGDLGRGGSGEGGRGEHGTSREATARSGTARSGTGRGGTGRDDTGDDDAGADGTGPEGGGG